MLLMHNDYETRNYATRTYTSKIDVIGCAVPDLLTT